MPVSFQTSIRSGLLSARWGSKLALAAAVLALTIPSRGHADPVPPTSNLTVFCFRITDIQRVAGDPGNDRFRFEFEVLNWTHQQAFSVYIAQNVATGLVVGDPAPFFAGAAIDMNGRPLTLLDVNGDGTINANDLEDANGNGLLDPGEDINSNGRLDNDPIPGNLNPPNNWAVASSSATAIKWSAGTPIPSVDLVDFDFSGTGPLLPGDPEISFMQFGNLSDPSSIVTETIDNGPNVQDGFVLIVDDLDPGEIVSFNWFLLDQFGNTIGGEGNNPYAFGAVNLTSLAGPVPPSPVFAGNTGFSQSPLIFFDSVYIVPNPARFAAEFGAGLTAPFLDPNDSIPGAFVNAQVLDRVILNPHLATNTVGAAHTITATFISGAGVPIAGQAIEFRVSGANTASGQVTTNAVGEAPFAYPGNNLGTDTITAWADENADSVQDPAEPFDVAAKTWAVTGAPTCNGQPATVFVDAQGNIVGGPHNGRPYRGRLRGGDGDDVIVGTDGADYIKGGAGDDVICGGDGNDRIAGGGDAGDDSLDDDQDDADRDDRIEGGQGNEADDGPRRGDGNDRLDGGAGDDLLEGGAGDDLILGGDGNDRLRGGRGDDSLDGGAGDDRLRGDNGKDNLTGGSGADRFRGGDGDDTATDFNPAEGDEKSGVENP